MKNNYKVVPILKSFLICLIVLLGCIDTVNAAETFKPVFVCAPDNDLYKLVSQQQGACPRFTSSSEGVEKTPQGGSLLILAQNYPAGRTPITLDDYKKAKAKKLRLYVEYPSAVPGMDQLSPSKEVVWERGVVKSDCFGTALKKMRILDLHNCFYIPIRKKDSLIAMARVVGMDEAPYGVPDECDALLYELEPGGESGTVLVATTCLSNFVTARYSPKEAWKSIWESLLTRMFQSDAEKGVKINLEWTPTVRPAYSRSEPLPADAEKTALRRGIDWYLRSGTVLRPVAAEKKDSKKTTVIPKVKNTDTDGAQIPDDPNIQIAPRDEGRFGDGTRGILEGVNGRMNPDGSQSLRMNLRADCNGEAAGAMFLAGHVFKDANYTTVGRNIADWLFQSPMVKGDREDPRHPAYGLIGWFNTTTRIKPEKHPGVEQFYGTDNARTMLGMMLAATYVGDDRYNERLLKALLANLRVTGKDGVRDVLIVQSWLVQKGWERYYKSESSSYIMSRGQADSMAALLWAYDKTGYKPFLRSAKKGLKTLMAMYPDKWTWRSGMQTERARIILPLAWLVRIEDTAEHRKMLDTMIQPLLATQESSGGIYEYLGRGEPNSPPLLKSNEGYGTLETSLINSNDDRVCDLLYTLNFVFQGLHEAVAATGNRQYKEAEDKIAEFLCRIQIQSNAHAELDGGWYRAFDLKSWDYWASNADAGWGAWCIESGWSQSWFTIVLALRQMNTSFWDATKKVDLRKLCPAIADEMLGDMIRSETSPAGMRKRITKELNRDLALWYPRSIDPRGGYHSVFGRDWTLRPYETKGLIQQARMVWTAAEVARRFPEKRQEYTKYAQHGYKFLRDCMWDKKYGGFYWEVKADGTPLTEDLSEMKHASGETFAVYALVALHKLTGDPEPLELAKQCFRWVDKNSHDKEHGGYIEALYRDGRPMLAPPKDRPEQTKGKTRENLGCKSSGSHIHLMLAWSALYEVWPDETLKDRTLELIRISRDVIPTWPGALRQFFRNDWTPAATYVNFGHDLEDAWYLERAERALKYPSIDKTRKVGKSIVDHAIEFGWDKKHGGFYYDGGTFLRPSDTSKFWWTQAEGLNALLLMHEHYGKSDPKYYRLFVEQWEFIEDHIVDPKFGGWFTVTDANGSNPRGLDGRFSQVTHDLEKAHLWKTAYHEIRAMLHAIDSLKRISEASQAP